MFVVVSITIVTAIGALDDDYARRSSMEERSDRTLAGCRTVVNKQESKLASSMGTGCFRFVGAHTLAGSFQSIKQAVRGGGD